MRDHKVSRLKIHMRVAHAAFCDSPAQIERAHCDLVEKYPIEDTEKEHVCTGAMLPARSLEAYCVVLTDDNRWDDSQDETVRRCYLAGCLFCEFMERDNKYSIWCARMVSFIACKAGDLSFETNLLDHLNEVCPKADRPDDKPPVSSPFNVLIGKFLSVTEPEPDFHPIRHNHGEEYSRSPSTIPPTLQ
jgi:hypothetical protein